MGYGKGEASRDFGVWPRYSKACRRAVDRLLAAGGGLSAYRSNPVSPVGPREGSWAWRLERLAETQFRVKHAIAVNSGTMALMAAIEALHLKKGGEIITSPFTFSATASAAIFMGYTPVFADLTRHGYTIDPSSVRDLITPETVAIMPVDLFGGLADYENLSVYDLPIIQDACQAVGATRGWLHGDIATWSFNGAKNVPAGEAGMVLTNEDELAERARFFISHGENFLDNATAPRARAVAQGPHGRRPLIGINGRLNEVTACVAYYGMRDVKANNQRRRELADELFRHLKHRSDLDLLTPGEVAHHALYVYPFRVPGERGTFIARMKKMGVEVGAGYITPPLHWYAALPAARHPMPHVDDLSHHSLCLLSQVRPPATKADMRYIADCIEAALDGHIGPRLRKIGFIAESVF
jgi:perosamine synthetase